MLILILLCIVTLSSITSAIEPLSMSIAGAAALGSWLVYDQSFCRLTECCNGHSIIANISDFERNLKENVYGQHIIQDVLVRALHAHFATPQPAKALVLSFHGTQGAGKNFVSKFIADAIYKYGMKSNFFRQFNGGLDFPIHSKVDIYKMDLQRHIMERVRKCERSMFVFDDVQKLAPGLLDAVKPFVDYHEQVQGLDFRKSIFIFLSNTGAGLIMNKTLELWKQGIQRDDIKLSDFESLIRAGALNEEGGLHMSENVASNLIDYYVPFLPLEEKHVRMCIKDEFLFWGYESVPEDAMKSILDDMVFGPGDKHIFSTSGCKRLSSRVGAYVHGQKYKL